MGLTARHALVLGPRPLLEGVTSLALHSHYLLVTTREHRLLALALANLGEAREGQDQGRKVERGSRLVCAVPHNSRTVLQMPRGNLEVVQPRALSVRMVAELLDCSSYGEAFLLAPRAGSSSADTLEVYTGRRLLSSKSGVGGLGHFSVFLKLPSRPLANSQVSAGDLGFQF